MKFFVLTCLVILSHQLIIAQNVTLYEYDKKSRLKSVKYNNGSIVIYNYDLSGNRNSSLSIGMLTEFIFIGNGNWSNASNWKNNSIPPVELPIGSEIIIDPIANGECILDVNQKILIGAKIRVVAGKKLRILSSVNIQ